MPSPIFYDPNRKRWRRLRLALDITGVLASLLIAFFIVSIVRNTNVPSIGLTEVKKPYHALKDNQKRKYLRKAGAHRKTKAAPSQVVLNSTEGIRAAFYVDWDAASFSSHQAVLSADRFAVSGVPARADAGRAPARRDAGEQAVRRDRYERASRARWTTS